MQFFGGFLDEFYFLEFQKGIKQTSTSANMVKYINFIY